MSIDIKDLTGGEVAGAGLFDELQRTSKAHLVDEYNAGRITGTDYATAYLGVMQSNLQVASQYVLQYQLTNQQILVLQEQVEQAKKQNELLELQKEQLRLANETAQYNLDNMLPAQYEGILEQNKTAVQNTLNTITQGDLLAKQIIQLDAQIDLTGKQEAMVDSQILTEQANTTLPTGGLTKATYDKTLVEEQLLNQKLETEKAQTIGTVDTIGGLVGTELMLKDAQANSFLRDAEQKAAKFYADVLSIAYSVSPSTVDPAAWGFGEADSTAVMNKVQAGIGVS